MTQEIDKQGIDDSIEDFVNKQDIEEFVKMAFAISEKMDLKFRIFVSGLSSSMMSAALSHNMSVEGFSEICDVMKGYYAEEYAQVQRELSKTDDKT
jgi:hypothetical protein